MMKDRIKLDPILERLRSRRGRPKKEEPIPEGTPLERCLDCLHWHSRGELEHKHYMDISTGRCKLTGLQCPAMFHCPLWESAGELFAEPKDDDP